MIVELRDRSKYKFLWQHIRTNEEIQEILKTTDVVAPKKNLRNVAGATICTIEKVTGEDSDGTEIVQEVAKAASFCSKRDQFCKRVGRMISVGRAMKQAEFADTDREALQRYMS